MVKTSNHAEDARDPDVSIVVYLPAAGADPSKLVGDFDALSNELLARFGLSSDLTLAVDGDGPFQFKLDSGFPVRIVRSSEPGYGVTMRQAVQACAGAYLILSDIDGAYALDEATKLVEALLDGAGMCVGIRADRTERSFTRSLKAWAARRLFGIDVVDIHCRFRAITRACWDRQKLGGVRDELSGEMLAKAALRGERIGQQPVSQGRETYKIAPLNDRLRNFWGEARYLLMLSPVWLFVAPAIGLGGLSLAILAKAGLHELTHDPTPDPIGNYWVILAAAMLGLSHLATMLAIAGHLYGVREGFRRPGALTVLMARRLSLETLLLIGLAFFMVGLTVLGAVAVTWVERAFQASYSVYLPVVGVLCLTLAGQTVFSGFLLSILAGNRAKFLDPSRSLIDHRQISLTNREASGGAHAFVVLAYKDSPFLRACVASVCAQTRPSTVVIATSTPSSYIDEIARSFGVSVKVNPTQKGIAGDWAFGLSATDARYVTLAHQDDVYYPTFAQQTLETFERSAKAALCFTGYEEIDDEGRPKSSKISKIKHLIQFFAIGSRERVEGRALHAILALGNTLPCSTVTYDRRQLAGFQFSTELSSNLDWDAWMSLLNRGETFLHVNERLVGRRHNALTETSALIRSGRRAEEDLLMFRRLWPKAIGDFIAYVYRLGY
jgi:hypothetical protein